MTNPRTTRNDDVALIQGACKAIAGPGQALAMAYLAQDYDQFRIKAGSIVVYEKRLVPLRGDQVVVARVRGDEHLYIGRARREVSPAMTTQVRLDELRCVPERAFALQGPVLAFVRRLK